MGIEGQTHRPIVDNTKCATCGVCVRGCPAEIIPELRREPDSTRGRVYTRLYADKYAPCPGSNEPLDTPPCQAGCPIGQDVRGYVGLIARRQFAQALALIRETNALPSVCGYVCHHPCEAACVRRSVDQKIGIKDLKRFVADHDAGGAGLSAVRTPATEKPAPALHVQESLRLVSPGIKPPRGKQVTIVGSGPAGLAAAYDLARDGFQVEILEALPRPGGMLRWAIPSFRLPVNLLDRDVDFVERMGVRVRTGVRFGVDIGLSDVRKGGASAVIIAIGTHESLDPDLENSEGVSGYYDCLTFLEKYASGERVDLGGKTVVVGIGNAAVDSARAALRCGAKDVTILARRGPEHAAADGDEVQKALAEGIKIAYWTQPERVVAEGGAVSGVQCIRTELSEAGCSGPGMASGVANRRGKPVPLPGSEFALDATSVISAVGHRPDLSWNRERLPFDLSRSNTFVVDDAGTTNIEGVYATGDAVTGPSTVVAAMAHGRQIARSVAGYLS